MFHQLYTLLWVYLVRTHSHACKSTWHAIDDDDDCCPFYIFPRQTEQHIATFQLNWARTHANSVTYGWEPVCMRTRRRVEKIVCSQVPNVPAIEKRLKYGLRGWQSGRMNASLRLWFRNKQAMHLIIVIKLFRELHNQYKQSESSSMYWTSVASVVCVESMKYFRFAFGLRLARAAVGRTTSAN